MRNAELLLKKNTNLFDQRSFRKKMRLDHRKNMIIEYHTKNFGEMALRDIIGIINLINHVYKAYKIPVIIDIGKVNFTDKLAYILLEILVDYEFEICGRNLSFSFKAEDSIWSKGIDYSPLKFGNSMQHFLKKFRFDIFGRHYRRVIDIEEMNNKEWLSRITTEISYFLKNNGVDQHKQGQLVEMISELLGNAHEHGNSDVLVDLDITDSTYVHTNMNDGSLFYGLNVVVLNISDTLFHEMLKNKMTLLEDLPDRYKKVNQAYIYHKQFFCEAYRESDFFTVSSFQNKISGSNKKTVTGGIGLTSLIRSLEKEADGHNCYMLSGDRLIHFQQERMRYDEDMLIGFNSRGGYLQGIPEKGTFESKEIFFPGTAYNLNFAIQKE